MWAQLIKARIRPGKEDEARNLTQEFEAEAGGNHPWVALTACVSRNDPNESYTLVVFESEERARENERSPEQAKRFERMMQIYDGQPEFVDLDVVYQNSR
jgi:heme-degrading monooxygenase HmoA